MLGAGENVGFYSDNFCLLCFPVFEVSEQGVVESFFCPLPLYLEAVGWERLMIVMALTSCVFPVLLHYEGLQFLKWQKKEVMESFLSFFALYLEVIDCERIMTVTVLAVFVLPPFSFVNFVVFGMTKLEATTFIFVHSLNAWKLLIVRE